ncbi:MAG: bifunctional folylpolyglutamate synthase/dihydrofolate synthase [Oscillospiraceae bacterium]|nr:bifunctional folylpolyglutamate synthase/dihydrofolate synthase [Oscillospiraceae bacterium]
MNLNEALEYIHSTCWKGSVPGLSRTEELLHRMGNPHKTLKYIHVVGTNGKGSTCAMLASVLRSAGYKVGLYTSPYIFRFEERMQINGAPISEEELCRLTEEIRPHADAMEDKPTEFELITCLAFSYFARQKADIVVLEAGMGGEMDSTNVIPAPEVAVMCNIGLDHTEYLGNTLEDIARTKAGVVKEGSACVLYPSTPDVEKTVQEICKAKSVLLTVADFAKLHPVENTLQGQTFHWGAMKNIHLPLLGEHQQHNACVVLETLMHLRQKGWNIPDSAIYHGLAQTAWPGRFQLIGEDPLFIIDGGHNPQCMEALTKNLEIYLKDTHLTVLTGVMADKDRSQMYPPLLPYVSQFVTVTPANPRALPAEDLAEYLRSLGKNATPCDSVLQGVETALTLAKEQKGAVLTCGSLYMLGEVVEAHQRLTP